MIVSSFTFAGERSRLFHPLPERDRDYFVLRQRERAIFLPGRDPDRFVLRWGDKPAIST